MPHAASWGGRNVRHSFPYEPKTALIRAKRRFSMSAMTRTLLPTKAPYMALSYGPLRSSLGGQTVVGNVTFDATYTTGGLAFDHTKLGANNYAAGPANVICNDVPTGAHQGKQAVWDPSTGKLVALTAAGVEVSNATDLSAMAVRVEVHM